MTVASAERSFSKLKLLKNYLRSTMSQERLNSLAMCTIERAILDTIDLNTVLDDFASRNARMSIFLWEAMDIMECKYKVIKLILEVQIYYCFSLHCSPIIIQHVKFWQNSRQPSRVSSQDNKKIFSWSRISNK